MAGDTERLRDLPCGLMNWVAGDGIVIPSDCGDVPCGLMNWAAGDGIVIPSDCGDVPCGLMNWAAGDGIVIPSDCGDGAGTKDDGDGTWSVGLPGDGAMTVDGDGVTTCCNDGGDASGKLLPAGDADGYCKSKTIQLL